jgi:hypothetical protein
LQPVVPCVGSLKSHEFSDAEAPKVRMLEHVDSAASLLARRLLERIAGTLKPIAQCLLRRGMR